MQKILMFDQGEERHVRLQIKNIRGDPFTILKAQFELVCGCLLYTSDAADE